MDCSYGYRWKRSIRNAVERILVIRENDKRFAALADVGKRLFAPARPGGCERSRLGHGALRRRFPRFCARAGRARTLALDLNEEFRAPLVDSLALGLLNRRLLRAQDFGRDEADGVRLSPRGLRVFFCEFSDKLESRVTVRRIGRPLSYRKLMEVQVRALANVLLGKAEGYVPFKAR